MNNKLTEEEIKKLKEIQQQGTTLDTLPTGRQASPLQDKIEDNKAMAQPNNVNQVTNTNQIKQVEPVQPIANATQPAVTEDHPMTTEQPISPTNQNVIPSPGTVNAENTVQEEATPTMGNDVVQNTEAENQMVDVNGMPQMSNGDETSPVAELTAQEVQAQETAVPEENADMTTPNQSGSNPTPEMGNDGEFSKSVDAETSMNPSSGMSLDGLAQRTGMVEPETNAKTTPEAQPNVPMKNESLNVKPLEAAVSESEQQMPKVKNVQVGSMPKTQTTETMLPAQPAAPVETPVPTAMAQPEVMPQAPMQPQSIEVPTAKPVEEEKPKETLQQKIEEKKQQPMATETSATAMAGAAAPVPQAKDINTGSTSGLGSSPKLDNKSDSKNTDKKEDTKKATEMDRDKLIKTILFYLPIVIILILIIGSYVLRLDGFFFSEFRAMMDSIFSTFRP